MDPAARDHEALRSLEQKASLYPSLRQGDMVFGAHARTKPGDDLLRVTITSHCSPIVSGYYDAGCEL